MARNDFTTAHAAAHVAHYLDAQPVAVAQVLTMDEQIDRCIAEMLIARAEHNDSEISRLRAVWLDLKAQIDAESATTADLEADACVPFEPTVAEACEARSVTSTRERAYVLQGGENPTACTTIVPLNLDCLIAAHEAQPDTKAQRSAWEWLAQLTSATMRGAAYRIPSARWSNTVYTSTADSCSCESRKPCWHMAAAATLDRARENECLEHLATERDALALALELWC